MRQYQETIDGRQCHIFIRGGGDPVIFWGIQPGAGERAGQTAGIVEAETRQDFSIAAFEAGDWNRDFSPWPQEGAREGECFPGGGKDTLLWLTRSYLPHMEALAGGRISGWYIGGYSLAGLFALWTFCEDRRFLGAASVSGSLWYPGWLDCLRAGTASKETGKALAPEEKPRSTDFEKRVVYLSLGRREEKTRNLRMASVGENTRMTLRLLQEDTFIEKAVLEWNPGGHFTEPERRMARALTWLLDNGKPGNGEKGGAGL